MSDHLARIVSGKKNRQMARGFTFLEIMLVVVIIGILATIGFPTLKSGLESSRLSGAATEMIVAFEYARLTAMTTGKQIRVTINSTAGTILVEGFEPGIDLLGTETELDEDDVDGGAFQTMKHPVNKGQDYLITLPSDDRFDGVRILSAVFGGGSDNFVTFYALGTPSASGTVTLDYGGKRMYVSVDALTGKVTTSG